MFNKKRVVAFFAIAASIVYSAARAAPPAAPTLSVQISGQAVTLQWGAVPGASGYVLYYAPYPNVDSIGNLDMGLNTSWGGTLPAGSAYYVAVRARNAEGESPYSNVGIVIIPSGGAAVLRAGDYWEFEWSETSRSSSSGGTTSNERNGAFRVTLGAPQLLGGRTAFPIVVTGDASVGKPIWNWLVADGPVLLGSRDAVTYSTISGGDAGGWKGTGFFAFFPYDLTATASPGTYQGNYRTTSAWVVARSRTSGGCTFYPEVGESICEQDYSSYSEREYHKAGVGAIGYRFSSSALFQGGGFISTHNVLRTVELVKSSKVADDGTVFTGPPWRSLPELGGTPSLTVAAAHDGSVLAFRGGLQLLTTQPPPWMQVLDASGGAWNPAVPSGAQVSAVLGVSGGSLYALGRTTTGASLLRFNAALSRWDAVGPAPTFSNLRGGAALANGELVALDTPGLSQMVMYIYSPVTGSWRKGATYSSTILRPAIAAVDNDVYVIGGYRSRSSSNGITGTVRRYRPLMNTWENLTVTMPTPRDDAVAVAVGGKLYVIGGWGETIDVPKGRVVEIFDTATGAWSAGPVLPQSRDTFGAAALDGRIYVIGGRNSENAWVNSGFVLLP